MDDLVFYEVTMEKREDDAYPESLEVELIHCFDLLVCHTKLPVLLAELSLLFSECSVGTAINPQ